MTKEFWLIPKRSNLHQTVVLIKAIIERNYDGSSWSQSKQNDLGVNLSRWGATLRGRNISNQSIRTLAALPQYFGFLYIDSNSTPSRIRLTPAGYKLVDQHIDDLEVIENLRIGEQDNKLIETSDVFLEQFEKLQITNPIIIKDCINISVFPLLFTLRLLLKLDYLDKEEVGYFLFKTKDHSELSLRLTEIRNFRELDIERRKEIIREYEQTDFGRLSLVKAPYANYFFNLLSSTGIINRSIITYPNPGSNNGDKIEVISIKDESLDYVNDILLKKYQLSQTYDFGLNVSLWINYIGNPSRLHPPRDLIINNNNDSPVLIMLSQNGEFIDGNQLNANNSIQFPVFLEEEYLIKVFDQSTSNVIKEIVYFSDPNNLRIELDDLSFKHEYPKSINDLTKRITDLTQSRLFPNYLEDYFNLLYQFDGVDRSSHIYLRGAYYEFYFFELLNKLQLHNLIDDVTWFGKIGKFGLPTASPGGKSGNPDIVFKVDGKHFILELTTIRATSRAMQFSAEAASVPDHIRTYSKDNPNSDISGIFCAPSIHSRTRSSMRANLIAEGFVVLCIEENDFLDILNSESKDKLIEGLLSFKEPSG